MRTLLPKVCKPSASCIPHQANKQEVTSKAIQEARRATRLAEAEARRLARENAALTLRLERKIDFIEQALSEPSSASTPTPYNTLFSDTNTSSTNTKYSRPANIITNFSDFDDPFDDGLATGGMVTALPAIDPNHLLNTLGHPRSIYTPARAPIPTPIPPFPDCPPLTPEGRRRSAERMINAPARERALAAERAYLAASNATWYEFEESRSDKYALAYTILRKNINLPVRNTMARMSGIVEEEGNAEDEADDEEEEEGSESSDGSLGDAEFNVSGIYEEEDLIETMLTT